VDEFAMLFVTSFCHHPRLSYSLSERKFMQCLMFCAGCVDWAWPSLWNSSKAGAHTINY